MLELATPPLLLTVPPETKGWGASPVSDQVSTGNHHLRFELLAPTDVSIRNVLHEKQWCPVP
jgi:hypothetical protein